MGALEFYEGARESYWVYRIDLPPDSKNTKRRQQRVTRDRKTGARWTSKKACQKAMQAHEVELRTGVPITLTHQSLDEYMEQWLADASSRLTPSSILNYRGCWNRLSPHLASLQLQSVQTLAIQLAIRVMEQRYAPGTIRLDYTILHAALQQAVQWNLIPRNPADGVVLPANKPTDLKAVWTIDETRRFLAKTQHDDLHALWRLLLDTGMRIGEALALDWDHVNIDASPARVRIDRTLSRLNNHEWYVSNATKTRRSRRTLAIQPETAAALRVSQDQQAERKKAYGTFWSDTGLVFDRDGGDIMSPKFAAKQLDLACLAAGVPRRTPHELRHTFTTLAVQRGVPLKLIADRLGHANTDLIAEIYAHVTEAGDQLVAEALRDVLNPPIPTIEPASCLQDDAGSENPSDDAEIPVEEDYRA